jgi:hypothetical protein
MPRRNTVFLPKAASEYRKQQRGSPGAVKFAKTLIALVFP